VVVLAIGAVFVPLPYYAIAPGSARQVNDLIRVTGGRVYPPRGQVLFTTVSLGPVQNVYEAVDGWLDPAVDLVPERQILGDAEDRQQYQQQNVQAMDNSKEFAEYVAFRKLGYDVAVRGEGALVVEVEPQYPAAQLLRTGDVIVAADGKPVALSDDLVTVIRSHRPGEVVHLSVGVAGSTDPPRAVDAPLGARDDGTPILGIQLQTFRQRFAFPFRVDIDSGQVGGPSAGLAFTLAILDALTPGELTGGVPIAVTGTINPDGSVGPVGGVSQKTVAVKRAGAKLFIVPSAEFAIAKARAGRSLRVEKADTLDEALHVLATLRGSNALALAGPGGTGTRG
jgi:PDZ domain-containing protein